MFYLIGLGLNLESIGKEALETIRKADKVYLENYTIKFPYNKNQLEKIFGKKIIEVNREGVESDKLILESKSKDITLLVYGSPLMATTHISLILSCKKGKIKYKILHNSSIFDAVSETGLQLYKFGKITSMPSWEQKGKSLGFLNIIKNNKKISAHSLILIDIGLSLKKCLEQLEQAIKQDKNNVKLDKIVVCERMGFQSKFYYSTVNKLKKAKIKEPFCLIIPGKLHFTEQEALEILNEKI